MAYAHLLRDEEDKVVTAELSLCLEYVCVEVNDTYCQMEYETFDEIEKLAEKFEVSLRIVEVLGYWD